MLPLTVVPPPTYHQALDACLELPIPCGGVEEARLHRLFSELNARGIWSHDRWIDRAIASGGLRAEASRDVSGGGVGMDLGMAEAAGAAGRHAEEGGVVGGVATGAAAASATATAASPPLGPEGERGPWRHLRAISLRSSRHSINQRQVILSLTLPLHCRYIAVTLSLHCRYIAVTLPLHCRYIAVTLPRCFSLALHGQTSTPQRTTIGWLLRSTLSPPRWAGRLRGWPPPAARQMRRLKGRWRPTRPWRQRWASCANCLRAATASSPSWQPRRLPACYKMAAAAAARQRGRQATARQWVCQEAAGWAGSRAALASGWRRQ